MLQKLHRDGVRIGDFLQLEHQGVDVVEGVTEFVGQFQHAFVAGMDGAEKPRRLDAGFFDFPENAVAVFDLGCIVHHRSIARRVVFAQLQKNILAGALPGIIRERWRTGWHGKKCG